MERSDAREALFSVSVVLVLAALAMFLVHLWRLPGLLRDLLPVARGTIAFFLGGAAVNAVSELRAERGATAFTRHSLHLLVLGGLLVVYLIPIYCNYLHFRSDLAADSDRSAAALARELEFGTYLQALGENPTKFNPDDAPDGDGFFDMVVGLFFLADVLVQKLFTNVLHIAVAGYASLFIWYLVFVMFSYAGAELFWDR